MGGPEKSWHWLSLGLATAATAGASCGKTSHSAPTGRDSGGEAGASGTPDFAVETDAELCRARAALRCASYRDCCSDLEHDFDVELCETVEGWPCDGRLEPENFDATEATRCLELDWQAREQCLAPRSDSQRAHELDEACAPDVPEHFAAIGDACGEHRDCMISSTRAIYCNEGFDGTPMACLDVGPLGEEGDRCVRSENCESGLVCAQEVCRVPRADGDACQHDAECQSGYCCDAGRFCSEGSTCQSTGRPNAAPERCDILDELNAHAYVLYPMPGSLRALAVDESHLYLGYERTIQRIDKATAARKQIYEWQGSLGYNYLITQLALSETHLYFAANLGFGRVDLESGEATEFERAAPATVLDIAVTEDEFLMTSSGCAIARMPLELAPAEFAEPLSESLFLGHLAFDDDDLFCAAEATIYRAPRDGGDWEVLVTNDRRVGPVVSNGNRLWWVSNDHTGGALPGELRTMSKSETTPTALGPATRPAGVLLRDEARDTLYWAGSTDHIGVYHDGDDTTGVLYDELPTYYALAQDQQYLYWANEYGIMRLLKE